MKKRPGLAHILKSILGPYSKKYTCFSSKIEGHYYQIIILKAKLLNI